MGCGGALDGTLPDSDAGTFTVQATKLSGGSTILDAHFSLRSSLQGGEMLSPEFGRRGGSEGCIMECFLSRLIPSKIIFTFLFS